MVPIYDTTTGNATSGFARCYAINDDGKSVFKWEIRGWYDFPRSLYLNADGSGLVRVHDIGKADPRDPIGMPDKKKMNRENYGKIIVTIQVFKKG